MKAYLQTFGCKVNSAETDSISALLVQNGWEITEIPAQADALIVNSCTVTASGDNRMFQALKKLRKTAPNAVILLTGCYVQAFPKEAEQIPDADIITGTKHRLQIPALLEQYFQNPHRISAVEQFISGESFESLPQGCDAGHTRAFLKIQDGCNRFCSYCIIPYARGRCRSRNLTEIREEALKLVSQGYHEIVLCGINLACYGQEEGLDIADAVKMTAESGISQIRLSSLEPDGLTPEVLKKLSQIPQLLPHFHISVQSGCDRTLKAMHRHYTCAEYEELVKQLRALFPYCAVTTDIMTGFPDETEEDFSETLEFVKRVKFSQIHIFRYSPRSGTPAAKMKQIPEQIKKERSERLLELSGTLHREYLETCIGQVHRVLFERQKSPAWHNGHAENYAVVLVPAKEGENFRNQIFDVKITGLQGNQLIGEIIHNG